MHKILVVDDEKKVLEVVEAYLKKDGYDTYTADSGTKALERFRTVNPDLIILDLMLPDLSGEEICRIIRRESRIPIIMLTAKSHEEDRISGISMGADDYLVKPFSPRELVVRVRAILRRVSLSEPLSDQLSFHGDSLRIDTRKHLVMRNDGLQRAAGHQPVEQPHKKRPVSALATVYLLAEHLGHTEVQPSQPGDNVQHIQPHNHHEDPRKDRHNAFGRPRKADNRTKSAHHAADQREDPQL